MGFFNQIKVNMLNYSNIKHEADTWYKIDILLDWDTQETAIFLSDTF